MLCTCSLSIGSVEGWDVSEAVRLQIVNPPKPQCRPGRPRVRRILSQGEEIDHIHCGRCNGSGHNRQTCTNSVPLRRHQTKGHQASATTTGSWRGFKIFQLVYIKDISMIKSHLLFIVLYVTLYGYLFIYEIIIINMYLVMTRLAHMSSTMFIYFAYVSTYQHIFCLFPLCALNIAMFVGKRLWVFDIKV